MRLALRALAALLTLLILALPGLALPALAREEITSFDTRAVLDKTGTLDVTETIDVNAEGDEIRHGIFRDIPTILTNPDGSTLYAAFHVLDVEQDGRKAEYGTEAIANGERIRIGNADSYVSYGPHRYVIRYTMSRQARFFPDHDELFWNATGNYWAFPIVKATAELTLPEGANISKVIAYVGRPGSQDQGTATRTGANMASFSAGRELGSFEGLTFAAAFQKGIVSPPSGAAGGLDWLSDHRAIVLPPVAALLVLGYFFAAWSRVGRDPRKGTVIPLFYPPEGLSPAATQWIERMGFKGNGWNALTADLFNLGVKGLVTVDNSGKSLVVTGTGATPTQPLTPDEQVLYDYFGGNRTTTLDTSTGAALARRRAEMMAAISRPNGGKWFRLNIGWSVLGVLIAALCLGVMVLLRVFDPAWLIGAAVAGVVVAVVFLAIQRLMSGGGLRSVIGLAFIAVWVVVFGGGAFSALSDLPIGPLPSLLPAIAAGFIVLVSLIFAFIMKAPTAAGRQLMDRIEGFAMYLRTAEQNRLNIEGEPPLTLKRFEAILPFAIALGVEKPWSDKFNAALAAGQVPDATGVYYGPAWYSGRDITEGNSLSSNISSISSGMAAAMAASVPSQSSSSGFSGGGSGGGGGGGGGGGW
ncbi:MAG TPA: DUF2207 domain-containing protein [Devosia sp.]|nr:DUF2207 domain-containing protein [Devosia sp.]